MGHVTASNRIQAPIEPVWTALADITALPRWTPGVLGCHLLTDQGTGVGAIRFIDRGKGNYLKEEVVAWEPPHLLTFRVIETSFPLQTSDIRFSLEAGDGGTAVTMDITYRMKFGILGRLMDLVFVRRAYRKGMPVMLGGLQQYVEASGGGVPDEVRTLDE